MYNNLSPIIFSYDELDRIFFERIRRELVSLGVLPDVTNYQNDLAGYNAAKALITASGGRVCEIFGPGVADARDEKTYDKVVINRTKKSKGNWGGGSDATFFEPKSTVNPTRFVKKRYPDHNYDVHYDIRLITYTTASDRRLSDVCDSVLPGMNYIPTVNPNGTYSDNLVLVKFKSDFTYESKYFIERSFLYCIEDVWLGRAEVLNEDVPQLTTISITTKNLESPNDNLQIQTVSL